MKIKKTQALAYSICCALTLFFGGSYLDVVEESNLRFGRPYAICAGT
jgi:hypothetical protein